MYTDSIEEALDGQSKLLIWENCAPRDAVVCESFEAGGLPSVGRGIGPLGKDATISSLGETLDEDNGHERSRSEGHTVSSLPLSTSN